jgi:hypothetical protein
MKVTVLTHSSCLVLEDLSADATGWDLKQKLYDKYNDGDKFPQPAEQALVRSFYRHRAVVHRCLHSVQFQSVQPSIFAPSM